KTLPARSFSSFSSNRSGISAQPAIAMKAIARIQRIRSGPMACMSHAPTAPAAAWLRSVAVKIPATIGHGRLKRVARTSERSWVLSPISAIATIPAEISSASNGKLEQCLLDREHAFGALRHGLREPRSLRHDVIGIEARGRLLRAQELGVHAALREEFRRNARRAR